MAAPVKIKFSPTLKYEAKHVEPILEAAHAMADDIKDPAVKARYEKIADSMKKEAGQFLKDAKSGFLQSRMTAFQAFHKNFNKYVDEINDQLKEEAEAAKAAATKAPKVPKQPKKVKLLDLSSLKIKDAKIKDDLKHLLEEMDKVGNWEYTGKGTGGDWTPSFSQHKTHTDSGTKGWKAYIDQPSQGSKTTWRLYFRVEDYDDKTGELQVKMLGIKQDH